MSSSRPIVLAVILALTSSQVPAQNTELVSKFKVETKLPVAGPVEIFPLDQVRPGMMGTAYTTFEGNIPEPFPVEIVGLLKNQWGPGQDIIMAKVHGRAEKTGVAGGMSGSPVYIDGKLLGAISLRFGAFLNEPMAGITPISLMLEINEKDGTRTPQMQVASNTKLPLSPEIQASLNPQLSAASAGMGAYLTPIETPLTMSGINDATMAAFGDTFRQLGLAPVAGGASASMTSSVLPGDAMKLAAKLPPGAPVSMVLMDGDFSIASGCTVTYNDYKHVLICGHPFLNYGKLEMPMATADVVTTLGSSFQPTKVLNAETMVGSFVQDRHSGMLGMLGQKPHMIPVEATVHAGGKSKTFHYEVFQNSKYTSLVMTLAAFNTLTNMNETGEDVTFHTRADFKIDGYPDVKLDQLFAAPDNAQIPGPMALSFWLGDRFGRVFQNSYEAPNVTGVKLDFDLLAERRTATIEHVWIDRTEAHPGDEITGRIFLKPYRGERITKDFKMRIPMTAPRGELRLQVSDAEFVNRYNNFMLNQNRTPGLTQIINVMNQERANNALFVSMMQTTPTVYIEDKIMPSIPSSIASVIDTGKGNRLTASGESMLAQMTIPVDQVLSGLQTVSVTIK